MRLADRVVRGADRVNDLIKSLLDVTRSRFGAGLAILRSPMDVATVGLQIVEELRLSHPTRHILFNASGNSKGTWDKPRVGQVLSNLISNAIQYGFADTPINVSVKGENKSVNILVHNLGEPIPVASLKKIFNPLTRLNQDKEKADQSTNLGLGLFITSEVVEAHGGSIEVTSTKKDGTTFAVQLPR